MIPYWQDEVQFCRAHGVDMIALAMHPGFVVYNPETLLRLREAVGPEIGVNFDPSHLFWQGIDPISAVRELGDSIFHVHAKDTIIDPVNTPINGVLDTKPYADEANRCWIFRTVWYCHDLKCCKDVVSNLLLVGQRDESALAMMATAMISIAAQAPAGPSGTRFFVLDGSPADAQAG